MHPTRSLLKRVIAQHLYEATQFQLSLRSITSGGSYPHPSSCPIAIPQPRTHSFLVKGKANHILWGCFRKPDQCCFDIPATHVPILTNGNISGRPPLQMEWGSRLLNQHFPSCWQYRVMRRFKGEQGKRGKGGRWHLTEAGKRILREFIRQTN